ncbi:MAG TPA: hypothetical protein VEQ63_00300 [Bryobacteraceae bacterium]|nr:hypothetical protein [Bryobacteraceae bacterium]
MRSALLLALTITGGFGAQSVDFEWKGSIARGRLLEVRGVNGDIHAEPSTSGEVEIVAKVVNEKNEQQAPVNFRTMKTEMGMVICAAARDESECQPVDGPVSGPGARVDFFVRLPEGVHFRGRTVNGGVAADLLQGDVEAYTVNGGVRISTTGTAQARTVNGSITASLLTPFWKRSPQFSTVNGAITLSLPSRLNASVVAETRNGKVVAGHMRPFRGKVTDQSIDVVLGTGSGEDPMTVRTVNGTIVLKKAL